MAVFTSTDSTNQYYLAFIDDHDCMEDRAESIRESPDTQPASPVWSGLKPPANLDIAGARKGVGCNVTGGVGDVMEGNYHL